MTKKLLTEKNVFFFLCSVKNLVDVLVSLVVKLNKKL